jgi:L-cysteine/cystine lyase
VTDPNVFRAQFPVLERHAYLNAGTEGPVPRAAVDAVRERVELDASEGRSGRGYFERVRELAGEVRAAYAGVLGCDPTEVALTGSTTDGINTVIAGLDLRAGDEILISDEEHPGLLGPVARARHRHGATVRVAPFDDIASHATPTTRLVACSHVSWVSGRVVDTQALAGTGVPVLLDAAQALGAVPVDVRSMGCDFYAASGQKWLCGPSGSGCLYVRPDRLEELLVPWPAYGALTDPPYDLQLAAAESAGAFDHGFPSGVRSAWALASLRLLEDAGWEWVHERSATLAAGLADSLAQHGRNVWPRGRSTLVSWSVAEPQDEVERLAADGFIVRSIPRLGLVRASVGAWSSVGELEAVAALASD